MKILIQFYSEQHEAIHRGAFKCKFCNIPFTKTSLRAHRCVQAVQTKNVKTLQTKKARLQCDKCQYVADCNSHLSKPTYKIYILTTQDLMNYTFSES